MFYIVMQEVPQDQVIELSGAVWFFLGVIAILILLSIRKYLNDMDEEDKKPTVIFIDLTTGQYHILGKFQGYSYFDIPIPDGRSEKFWSIETRTMDGNLFLVPAYGTKTDMVMENDRSRLKIVHGVFIGMGNQGQEVIDEWTDFAFPPETYNGFKPKIVPKNFVLCRPNWNRAMEKTAFDNVVMGMAHLYSVIDKLTTNHEQEIAMINTKYSELFISKINTAIYHELSRWTFILQAFDAMMMERTTPLYVVSRLMHISPNSTAYSALAQSMNHGGFQVVSSFVQSIKRQFNDLAENLDMFTMGKDNAELTFAKVNQMRQDLVDSAQQLVEMKQDQQKLLQMIKNNDGGTQPSANPVIAVNAAHS